VRELCAGIAALSAGLYDGALFSCGDGHAARAMARLCINRYRVPTGCDAAISLHKQQPLTGRL